MTTTHDSTVRDTTREHWSPAGWNTGAAPAGAPLVVDSWLVDDGAVRGLSRHLARFATAAVARGAGEAAVAEFLAAVPHRLPRRGAWFPRVEAWHGGVLTLWTRPAPPRAVTTRLWVPPVPDPRRAPTVKGPDLAALAALREQALRHGADDAVLWAADGSVLEAAHAALLWWRDGALCRPAGPVLPSVTAALLADLARRHGVAVRRDRCTAGELVDRPVWTLNALHGLRHAEGPRLPHYGGRSFEWWRAALTAIATPLSVPVHGGTGEPR